MRVVSRFASACGPVRRGTQARLNVDPVSRLASACGPVRSGTQARRLTPSGLHDRLAFTMLELIAVIVMLGLISAIGFIAVSGPLDQSQLTRMSQAIANADRKERESSRQSPLPGGLTIEASKGLLFYRASDRRIDLGSNLKITDVIVSSVSDNVIFFSQSGQSPTYAVRLESRRGASIWVVIVGMTGQVVFDNSSTNVRALFAMGGPA